MTWQEPLHATETAVPDRYTLLAHSETHLQLFRRALLPGPNGAAIATETAAPIYEYASVSARDIDTSWKSDSLDLELSVWGHAALVRLDREPAFNGDVQSASVRYRHGPVAVRLGRQHVAGGAARYARFDGAEVSAALGERFSLLLYGGFSVMPRWNERPGYQYLGAAADSQLRDLALAPTAARSALWLGGSRLAFNHETTRVGVSFHEQHEAGGLSHRNLGVDARLDPGAALALGGSAILELDSSRFADARFFADYDATRTFSVSAEYLHAEPSLLLSRQSVLSVFSSDSYEEGGGFLRWRPSSAITLQASGFVDFYSGRESGARTELSASAWLDARHLTYVRSGYARVVVPDNGYSSLRLSLVRRLVSRLESTLEGYLYWYDRAINGYRSSSVYAGTLTYRPAPLLSILWGASLARSPQAGFDAQTQLRVVCDFEFSTRGGRRQ